MLSPASFRRLSRAWLPRVACVYMAGKTIDKLCAYIVAPHTYKKMAGDGTGQFTYEVTTKQLYVSRSDYYIAYRPFCRVCRIVGHTTNSCPAGVHHRPRPGVALPPPPSGYAGPSSTSPIMGWGLSKPPPPPPHGAPPGGSSGKRPRGF